MQELSIFYYDLHFTLWWRKWKRVRLNIRLVSWSVLLWSSNDLRALLFLLVSFALQLSSDVKKKKKMKSRVEYAAPQTSSVFTWFEKCCLDNIAFTPFEIEYAERRVRWEVSVESHYYYKRLLIKYTALCCNSYKKTKIIVLERKKQGEVEGETGCRRGRSQHI